MKYVIVSLLFIIGFLPHVSAESSEDSYTLKSACDLSLGMHLGQITSLDNDSRFRDIVTDANYDVGLFYRVNDKSWGESIFFTVNSNGGPGDQRYAELFLVNCSSTSGQTAHFPVHRIEPNIQYSPEITKVTDAYILLNDWQNISGKSYHVSMIFDRKNSKFYHIRDEILKKNKSVKSFVKNNQFYWEIIGYQNKYLTVEVWLDSAKKRVFKIKVN